MAAEMSITEPECSPVVSRAWRSRTWQATAVAAMLLSVAGYAVLTAHRQSTMWYMGDLRTYLGGGAYARHDHGKLYETMYGPWATPFVYPPLAAYIFSWVTGAALPTMKLTMTIISLLSLFVVVGTAWRLAGVSKTRILVTATCVTYAIALWLEPVQQTLYYGQINIMLMALMLADLALSDRRWFKGIGIGLATGLKLTPGFFIVYLLCTRRLLAAAVAAGTFLVTVGIGFATLPKSASDYWGGAFTVGDRVLRWTVVNQSIFGGLMRVLPEQEVNVYWGAISFLVALLALACAVAAHRRGDELSAIVVCAGATLAISQISWTHHYVWTVPTLVLFASICLRRKAFWGWLAVAGFWMLFAAWPSRGNLRGGWNPHLPLMPEGLIWFLPNFGGEKHWNPYQQIWGNYYVLVILVLLLVTAVNMTRHKAVLISGSEQRRPGTVRIQPVTGEYQMPRSQLRRGVRRRAGGVRRRG